MTLVALFSPLSMPFPPQVLKKRKNLLCTSAQHDVLLSRYIVLLEQYLLLLDTFPFCDTVKTRNFTYLTVCVCGVCM